MTEACLCSLTAHVPRLPPAEMCAWNEGMSKEAQAVLGFADGVPHCRQCLVHNDDSNVTRYGINRIYRAAQHLLVLASKVIGLTEVAQTASEAIDLIRMLGKKA